MTVIDYLILAFLFFGAYKGMKKGLVKSLGGLVGLAASIWIGLRYYDNLADTLNERFNLIERWGKFLLEILPIKEFSFEVDRISLAIVNAGVQELKLPDFIKKYLFDTIVGLFSAGDFMGFNLAEVITQGLAAMLLKGAAFLFLFLVVGMMVQLLVKMIAGLFAVTPFGKVDTLFGILLGLAANTLLLIFIFGVISPAVAISAALGGKIAGAMQNAYLFTYLVDWFKIISMQLLDAGYL